MEGALTAEMEKRGLRKEKSSLIVGLFVSLAIFFFFLLCVVEVAWPVGQFARCCRWK